MADDDKLANRFKAYRPTKAVWAWSCVACIALTMIVGFTAGGWVTGGGAKQMISEATENAREHLVATLCVNKFVTASDAASSLAELKEASNWEQDDYIEDGGWLKIAGLKDTVTGAADLCADELVAMEGLPERVVEPAPNQG